jgi:hypothetical protein
VESRPVEWTDASLVAHLNNRFGGGEMTTVDGHDCIRWTRKASLEMVQRVASQLEWKVDHVIFYPDSLDSHRWAIGVLRMSAQTAAALLCSPTMAERPVPRPVAPTPDTPAVEWTDDELREWCTQTHGEPNPDADGRFIVWGESGHAFDSFDSTWNTGDDHRWTSATEAARILNAVKPGAAP